ncbi:MAG: SDR family oxidoreductase [Deltaproteobacteria bacterium]|nr:SDR family oxidoreductase [Deltaproteobacteria bacterium]
MKDKVAIVTGANTGIGKETARGLAKRGYSVVIACRDVSKGEAAKQDIVAIDPGADVHVIALDLASRTSIEGFVAEAERMLPRLDVLVNNAGLWKTARETGELGLESTFAVNHLGTMRLTLGLLPLLEKSAPARVVVLSSALHYRGKMAWDDLQFERQSFSGPAAYNQSKLANVLFTKALARRVKDRGVTVNAVHPGVVATELARDYPKLLVKLFHLFLLTPAQGAECSLFVATDPSLKGVTGEYFEKSRSKKAAKIALDESEQERLWTLSEALLARTV